MLEQLCLFSKLSASLFSSTTKASNKMRQYSKKNKKNFFVSSFFFPSYKCSICLWVQANHFLFLQRLLDFLEIITLNCQKWRKCSIDVLGSPFHRGSLGIGTIPKPFDPRNVRPWSRQFHWHDGLYRKACKSAFVGRFGDPLNHDFRQDETFAR